MCGERTLATLPPPPSPPSTGSRLRLWRPFQGLHQAFAVLRRVEQLRPQRIVASAVESVLRTPQGASRDGASRAQEENAPKRVLWYKPMAWLGVIRPHRRDEAWSASP